MRDDIETGISQGFPALASGCSWYEVTQWGSYSPERGGAGDGVKQNVKWMDVSVGDETQKLCFRAFLRKQATSQVWIVILSNRNIKYIDTWLCLFQWFSTLACKMGTRCGDSSVQQWRTYPNHSTNERHNHTNYLLFTHMIALRSSKSPQFKPSDSNFTTYVIPTWWTNVSQPIKHTHDIVLIGVWLSCISSSIHIYVY